MVLEVSKDKALEARISFFGRAEACDNEALSVRLSDGGLIQFAAQDLLGRVVAPNADLEQFYIRWTAKIRMISSEAEVPDLAQGVQLAQGEPGAGDCSDCYDRCGKCDCECVYDDGNDADRAPVKTFRTMVSV